MFDEKAKDTESIESAAAANANKEVGLGNNNIAGARRNVSTQEENKPFWSRFRWKVEDEHSPPEIYNWKLYMSVTMFGILGSARGYDEGCIAGSIAQTSFKHFFGLNDPHKTADQNANLKSNITAMVQLGSIGGAMLAMYTVDKLGRIRALQAVTILWIVGVITQITSQSVGQLYAGRLIEGLAIGQTTTIGPTYLAEVSPKAIRGLCLCIFAGAVYFGVMLAYFSNYGTALHIADTSNRQWIIPTAMKIPLSGIILIGSLMFCIESPRWLLRINKPDKAVETLAKLRALPVDHPYILGEIADINDQLAAEKEAVSNSSYWDLVKEIVLVKSVRYRFFAIAALAQILGQWSGANAITIYASELFALSGIRGHEVLKMTAVLGVVKFISGYLGAFFIIDILGRRLALYTGITIQLVSCLYFAIFLTIVPEAGQDGTVLHGAKESASKAAMASLYISGVGWTIGFNSIQYLLGSEVFPLKVRSFAQSLVMILHFANQYGNSKALPKMLIAMDNYGAFYFFVGVQVLALFWAWFFVPELAGRSLESMEGIFNLPWYLIGRRGTELCPDYSEINKMSYNKDGTGNTYNKEMDYDMTKDKPTEEFIEDVNDKKDHPDEDDK